jgi:hypothetical protein
MMSMCINPYNMYTIRGRYVAAGKILNAAGKTPIISSSNYFRDFEGGVMNGFPPAANASQVAQGYNPMGRTYSV